jgi:hypothetical protein
LSSEFTLYAIRDRHAARVLSEHDARLRVALVGFLRALFAKLQRTAAVDLDALARFTVAIYEGTQSQSYVEPDRLPVGRLERFFFPLLLDACSTPNPE